jgi:phosphoenolpyruvate carboxylase
VTAQVTAHTLRELRREAIELLDERLRVLAKKLSISSLLQPEVPELTVPRRRTRRALGPRGEQAVRRNPNEPWRQMVNLIIARLPCESGDSEGCYQTTAELLADLHLLRVRSCASTDTGWRAPGVDR